MTERKTDSNHRTEVKHWSSIHTVFCYQIYLVLIFTNLGFGVKKIEGANWRRFCHSCNVSCTETRKLSLMQTRQFCCNFFRKRDFSVCDENVQMLICWRTFCGELSSGNSSHGQRYPQPAEFSHCVAWTETWHCGPTKFNVLDFHVSFVGPTSNELGTRRQNIVEELNLHGCTKKRGQFVVKHNWNIRRDSQIRSERKRGSARDPEKRELTPHCAPWPAILLCREHKQTDYFGSVDTLECWQSISTLWEGLTSWRRTK